MKLRMFFAILGLSTSVAHAMPDANSFINKVCKEGDKAISLTELNSYADRRFGELQTKGNMSKPEFIKHIDSLFNDACADGDKVLTTAELNSPAGQKLMELLQ